MCGSGLRCKEGQEAAASTDVQHLGSRHGSSGLDGVSDRAAECAVPWGVIDHVVVPQVLDERLACGHVIGRAASSLPPLLPTTFQAGAVVPD